MAKHIMNMYEQVTIYQGKSADALSGYAYRFFHKGVTQRFLLFLDGLTKAETIVRRSTEQQAALVATNRQSSIRER